MGFSKHATSARPCDSLARRYLENNRLDGPLPIAWSGFRQLKTMVLGGNVLDGTLPDEWGFLDSLEILELHNNTLTGDGLPDAAWSWLADTLLSVKMSGNPSFHCDSGFIPVTWRPTASEWLGV